MRSDSGDEARRRGRARAVAVGALALVLAVVTGCSAGQQAATSQQRTNAGGANGQVGEIAVEHVSIRFGDNPVPGDQVYEAGETAALRLTIVNTGSGADELVGVASPVATTVAISGDTRVPGGQVLTAGYADFPASVAMPDATEIEVVLQGLTAPLRAGLTYPVTFSFDRAGELRLDVPLGYPDNLPLPPRAEPDEPAEGEGG